MNCPNCGASCAETQKYCTQCGGSLSAPSQRGSHWVPLLILLALSILGISVFFLSPHITDDACFQLKGGALYFNIDTYDGPAVVTVPETVDGELVTQIGVSCFDSCTTITGIALPEGIQLIDAYAFRNCFCLRGIQLPDHVEAIGPGAFENCLSLEAVSIPASVSFLAEDAFQNCPALTHIFYGGTCSQWLELYSGDWDSELNIYCADGNLLRSDPVPTP